MTKSILAIGFKLYKSNAGMYYFINEETKELVIAIVYVNDINFISSKYSLPLLELKQKFIMKQECHNLGETIEFLVICISYNHKDQKIIVD